MNIILNAKNSTPAAVEVQHVRKAGDALTKFCSHVPLRVALQPYLSFSLKVIQFHVLSQRSDVFMSLRHEGACFEELPLVQGPNRIDAFARSWSPEINEAI